MPLLCAFSAVVCAGEPANFIFASSDELPRIHLLLKRQDISGVQVVYTWKTLEPRKDEYDFSQIERDLLLVSRFHKRLFVQVQDRFFTPDARNVPAYILSDAIYQGGLAAQRDNPGEGRAQTWGWVAMQWVPDVRLRFQSLLSALAKRFDGKIYGLNLPETAADIDLKSPPKDFTCDAYFKAEVGNIVFARSVFKTSYVVQYVNFWPCEWSNDHDYMGRLFALAADRGIGLGGPDIVPGQKAQMANSYPLFKRYRSKLSLVAMAVQEPTLTYKDPHTGKPFSRIDFQNFARDFLGADIIFWSTASLGLARYLAHQ